MNRRSAIIVALVTFIARAPLLAAAEPRKPGAELQHAEYFSVWGWGYAGIETTNEKTFRAFMQHKPAAEDALRLISEGTPAAKTYGFLALKKLSPESFAKSAPRYFRDRTGVSIRCGCSPSTESLGTLVRGIADGKIVLRKQRE
jgi:hypothetical protein